MYLLLSELIFFQVAWPRQPPTDPTPCRCSLTPPLPVLHTPLPTVNNKHHIFPTMCYAWAAIKWGACAHGIYVHHELSHLGPGAPRAPGPTRLQTPKPRQLSRAGAHRGPWAQFVVNVYSMSACTPFDSCPIATHCGGESRDRGPWGPLAPDVKVRGERIFHERMHPI